MIVTPKSSRYRGDINQKRIPPYAGFAPQIQEVDVMRIRYTSWLAVGIAAAFLIVASASFSLASIAPLALGVSIGTLVVSSGIAYRYRRHVPTTVVAATSAVISAWTIVASQVFSSGSVDNLALASSLAIAGLSLVGLTVHELDSERVVHSIEVNSAKTRSEPVSVA
jgi:small basic protein